MRDVLAYGSTAGELSAHHQIGADIAKDARRRKAEACLFAAGAFLLALCMPASRGWAVRGPGEASPIPIVGLCPLGEKLGLFVSLRHPARPHRLGLPGRSG
jgi:hypothetical protein